MTDFPDLPAFLDRKINGVVTNPANYSGRRIVARKKRKPRLPDGAVRIYLRSKFRGLCAGWHYVVPTVGRKHVRVLPVGKTRAFRLPRSTWDSLKKESQS